MIALVQLVFWRTRLAAAVLAAGCAAPDARNQEANALWEQGQWDQALARMDQVSRDNPKDVKARQDYIKRRNEFLARLQLSAESEQAAGKFAEADGFYRWMQRVDPRSERAANGLRQLEAARRHAAMIDSAKSMIDAGELAPARALVAEVLIENPRNGEARALERSLQEKQRGEKFAVPELKTLFHKPVTLEFRDASLRQALEALSRTAGINFVLDRDVRGDAKTTIFVRNVRVEDALDLILMPNQLDKRIVSQNTVFIYQKSANKEREFQDLVIRTFYLGNADPKQTLNMIKTLLKSRDVFVDEKLNMLVMRDTPEAIELAEKLINSQDLAEPEVMLDIEILELSGSSLRDLGLKYPSIFTGPSGSLENTFCNISSQTVSVDRGLILSLVARDSDSRLLARPQVRVRNREKAKIHIGDRVPVISAVVTPSTGTPVVTDQVQYFDVGIKLDLEPAVHLNTDVGLQIGLEVSTFIRLPPTTNGTSVIQISTRNAATSLRLKDGETSVLAGLIQNLKSKTTEKVPLLGDIPLIGRLFSNVLDDDQRNEIVFLITPRVIRTIEPPDIRYAQFWSGSEDRLRTRGPIVHPVAGGDTPAAVAVSAVAPGTDAAGAAVTASADSGTVALAWDVPAKVKAGTEFTLSLKAATSAPMKGALFQFRYDPSTMQAVDVTEGNFFKKDNVTMVLTQRIDPPAGRISATLLPATEGVAGGEGVLLHLKFKALAANPKAQIYMLSASGKDGSDKPMKLTGFGPASIPIEP